MEDFIFIVKQGFYHVLDVNAYDHVLFMAVLAVIYTFKQWNKALWLITLFTLGHTFSLFMSVYGVLVPNSSLIEFLIPVTIVIAALTNIFTAGKSKQTNLNINLFFAFFFGIIHGFGFSSFFKMNVASSDNKFLAILEFSLGIELAQILIVFLILLLGYIFQTIFRFSKREWILIMSSIVIGATIPMFLG